MAFKFSSVQTLYICPSRLARAQQLHALTSQPDTSLAPQVVSCANVVLFDDLVETLAQRARGRRLTTFGARMVLASRVNSLPPAYRALCAGVRGRHRVLSALDEARAAGVEAARLRAPHEGPSAQFAQVLMDYEAHLKEHGWVDRSHLLRHAVAVAAEGLLPASLSVLERIVVLPGVELSAGRADLLAALARRGIAVVVRLPYDASRPGALAWGEQMLWQFEARGLDDVTLEPDDRVGTGPLAPARAAFLSSPTRTLERLPPQALSPVRLCSVSHEQAAYRTVAQVLASWRRAGTMPDKMAVVFAPSLRGIAQRVQCLSVELASVGLSGAGLSVKTMDVTPSAALLFCVLAILAETDAGEDAFDIEDFLQLWRARVDPASPSIPFWEIARWLRDCGLTRLAVEDIKQTLLRTRGRRSPEVAQQAAEALTSFARRLLSAPREASIAAWLDHLYELAFGPENIFGFSISHADERAALCRCLANLRQEAAHFAAEPTTTYLASEFADVLRAALALVREEDAKTRDADAILILHADEVVGTRFEKLVLIGVERNVWPRPEPHEAPLDESLRREINAQVGPRLPVFAAQSGRAPMAPTARDMWLFVEALHAAQSEMTLVYQDAGVAAQEGPSDIVAEWMRLGADATFDGDAREVCGETPQIIAFARSVGQSELGAAHAALRILPQTHARGARAHALVARGCRARSIARNWEVFLREEAAQKLAGDFCARVHSVSHLDTLGMCRYRFFAESALGLRALEPMGLGLGPKERGSLAHAALWVTYRALLQAGGLDWARGAQASAWEVARRAFVAHETLILRGASVHASLRASALADAWHAVATQLTRDLGDARAHPFWLEYRFGGRGADEAPPHTIREPGGAGVVEVRGAIDRVDCVDRATTVIDYKSSLPEGRTIGRRFQLALYAAVVVRDETANCEAGLGALWRMLWGEQLLAAEEVKRPCLAFEEALAESLWARVRPLLKGDISPDADDPRVCARCHIQTLCRVPRRNLRDLT